MSDAQQYAVWHNPRSMSRALQSWKFGYFQKLSPLPFTMGACNWPLILKLEHNIEICFGRIFDICHGFCVTWLWTWQKRQFWRVDRQSHTGLIFFCCAVVSRWSCGMSTKLLTILNSKVSLPSVCKAFPIEGGSEFCYSSRFSQVTWSWWRDWSTDPEKIVTWKRHIHYTVLTFMHVLSQAFCDQRSWRGKSRSNPTVIPSGIGTLVLLGLLLSRKFRAPVLQY